MVPEDVTTLQLPSRSTIEYMRREEMTTVSRVQKATVLVAADTVHLSIMMGPLYTKSRRLQV